MEKRTALTITAVIIVGLVGNLALGKYGGGTGEPNDPYQIWDANDMQSIGADPCDWGKCFRLMADTDVGEYTGDSFNIIGNSATGFTGVFDGNDHTIYNFIYDSNAISYKGLFGHVDGPNAAITNLGLIDPNVNAGTGSRVGSLVGYLGVGTIDNCYVEGGSVAGDAFVGGLVGWNHYSSTISNCHTTVAVKGDSRVGGISGINHVGTITNCGASGPVNGADMVGGLVGLNFGTINDSCAAGEVTAPENVGGLLGFNNGGVVMRCKATGGVIGTSQVGGLVGGHSGTIRDSYAVGPVGGDTEVGGLVGYVRSGWIINCYSTGLVSGTSDTGGLLGSNGGSAISSYWDMDTSGSTSSSGGQGKTTLQMLAASTYVSWSCGDCWTIDDGIDYPRLIWENEPGESISGLPGYAGGSGEPNDPYLIATAEQLNTIGRTYCHLDKHFVLIADIDLSGYTGTEYNIIADFTGVFDGNGHAISNFTYDSNDTDYIGLFGYLSGGEIKNLGLINPSVNAGTGDYVGLLVSTLGEASISGCYVKGGSSTGNEYVGALVGMSYSTGRILNCYATAGVFGNGRVGGLVGHNWGMIGNSYATGVVSGTSNIGGLVGYDRGTVVSSYWDMDTSGQTDSAAGIGKTTAQMQTTSTYVSWGYGGVWTIAEGADYPHLVWEDLPGILLTDMPVFPGGSGDPSDPYQIASAEQLNAVGVTYYLLDKHFVLTADIDLSVYAGTQFNIISNFTGVLDGNGHTISHFTYDSNGINNIGLFGQLLGAEVKNLGLIDPNITAGTGNYVGSLVGSLRGGSITNCYVDGGNVATASSERYSFAEYVGGLVGANDEGTVTDCYSVGGNVTGREAVGGLVGENDGTISECYVIGSTSGDTSVGGLCGYNLDTIEDSYSKGSVAGGTNSFYVGGLCGINVRSSIFNCYSESTVSGGQYVGGLCGRNAYTGSTIRNCYATGLVSGARTGVGGLAGYSDGGTITNSYARGTVSSTASSAGGLLGRNWNSVVSECYSTGYVDSTGSSKGGLCGSQAGDDAEMTDCFWDTQTSGQSIGYNLDPTYLGTVTNVLGKTTAQMMQQATFTNWDFIIESTNGTDDIWAMCEGEDYPKLTWEYIIGDFDGDLDTDFADFSILAGRWSETDGSFWCGGCDLTPGRGTMVIGYYDLIEFAEGWMSGSGE